jgi:hypothetical protein
MGGAAVAISQVRLDTREGVIDSFKDEKCTHGRHTMAIVRGLFTPEESVRTFVGARVAADTGDTGVIAGPFGKAGKCRVEFVAGTDATEGSRVRLIDARIESSLEPPAGV